MDRRTLGFPMGRRIGAEFPKRPTGRLGIERIDLHWEFTCRPSLESSHELARSPASWNRSGCGDVGQRRELLSGRRLGGPRDDQVARDALSCSPRWTATPGRGQRIVLLCRASGHGDGAEAGE